MPPKATTEPSAGAEADGSHGIPQLPWNSIPKFSPGVTNVQEYTQKLKFLAAMWPVEFLDQLAPRAALLVEGTAFRKVARLDASKLKVKSQAGIAALVEAIGGSWGATELEERYEYFEKALYGTVQPHDESHDSFLARMENNFIELLSRNTTLEEVQAYVLLRQSTLPAEDKKRILLEHEGELKCKPVVKSFRLLGSKFFNEFQSGKAQVKNRVYDVNFTESTDGDVTSTHFSEPSMSDRAYFTSVDDHEPELNSEFLDVLISQEDPDALAVANFEQEFEDFLQDIPEMHDAMVTYMEARSKLLEKKKGRGFWPIKGKSGFKKGRGKGKSKKDRDQLLARIARSRCRRCGQVGHWKAECPNPAADPSTAAASANVAEVFGVTVSDEIEYHEDEVQSDSESTAAVPCCQFRDRFYHIIKSDSHNSDQLVSHPPVSLSEAFVVQALKHDNVKQDLRNRLIKLKERSSKDDQVLPSFAPVPRYEMHPKASTSPAFCYATDLPHVEAFHVSALERPCHAILDTGASRCIIGENVWKLVLGHLSPDVQAQIKIKPSNVKFRFGNNQFLTSHFRVQIPLRACFDEPKRLWLAIEVVPGNTPFLFSKRAFKQLGGVLNTVNDTCFLKRLNRYVDLEVSKTDLYLIDLTQLCAEPTSHQKVFDNAVFHEGLVTESRGVDSSNKGHERVSSCGSHNFANSIRDSIDSSHVHVSNFDSKPSIDRDSDFASSLISSKHAESNDDDLEGCRRIHDRIDDHATADFDISTGGFKCFRDDGRARRCQSRDEANFGEHGSRAPKSSEHSAGTDGEPTGHSKSSGSSCDWISKWKQFDTNSWRNRCQSWSGNKTTSSTSERESASTSGDTVKSSEKSYWDSGQFNVDPGRGGRAHRGAHQCDSGNCSHGGSNHTGNSTIVRQRTRSEDHHVGQKAQGQDMVGGFSDRSGILPLVSGSLWKSPSRSTRVCPFLPDENRSRSSSQWPMTKSLSNDVDQLSDSDFDQEVNQVRDVVSKPLKPDDPFHAIKSSLNSAESILEEVYSSAKSPRLTSSVFLLEVYAGKNSPLTDLAQTLNLKVIRFSREDGNLATPWGRKKLWEWIDKYQPEHIWVAPECGAWGGWSRLNQFKSVDLNNAISQEQTRQLIHVKLCSQLCDLQVRHHRHFHLEQPLGSRMIFLPEFQPIFKQTFQAKFDMCALGLKIPKTSRFLKKRSQVFSTHEGLVIQLNKCQCPNNHEHQHIEGTVFVDQQRMPLTRFCATYCSGFVKFALKALRPEHEAFVNEDEPPTKRVRFSSSPAKRIRLNSTEDKDPKPTIGDTHEPEVPDFKNQPLDPNLVDKELGEPLSASAGSRDAVNSEPSSMSERWKEAFRMAHVIAPRVGNHLVDDSSLLIGLVQSCISDMTVQKVFVCRGTERLQLPLSAVNSPDCHLRHTACMHRNNGEVHIIDTEDWTQLKRLQRIRNTIPSKLTITSFGTAHIPDNQLNHPKPPHVPSKPSGQLSKFDGDTTKGPTVSQLPEICEGWAPPPTPIHGPLFRNLSDREKADIVKLHKNLGHPDPNVLADHLKIQGAHDHIVAGAREYVCDACVESTGRRHQRPAKLHDPVDFNHTVGIDSFYWSGRQGFQVHVLHCIDEASLFHLGRRTLNRNPDHVDKIWQEFWTAWAGSPHTVYMDPAGEFRSQAWKSILQGLSVNLEMTTEAWQRGRIERHGDIIKSMLDRFDQDHMITSTEHLDQVLLSCFMAKNSLIRHHGYSPEQIVLGKSTKLPASLSSDESGIAHSLAVGDTPESERFRNLLDLRSKARVAFLKADNDHAIRRALLRKSCPVRGPYEKGQLVMYWMKAPKASRLNPGRWHGPAKIICQESPSAVWVSHGDRLFKCAPESLRPASMREWSRAGPLRVPSELTEGPQGDRSAFEISPPDYSPTTVAPDEETEQQVNPEATPVVTPQSSLQPEMEAIPAVDVPVSETSLNTPSVEPHQPLGTEMEPLDLDSDTSVNPTNSEEQVLLCSPLDPQDFSDLLDCSVFQPGEPDCRILLAEDGLPFHEHPKTCQVDECFSLSKLN